MPKTLPDRVSDAGPEAQAPLDWRDLLWVADENISAAKRMEQTTFRSEFRNRDRITAIDHAIEALQEAKELLCR